MFAANGQLDAGSILLIAACVPVVIVLAVFFRFLRKWIQSQLLKLDPRELVGRVGRATSDLRPSGVAEFDGCRVATSTEGTSVDVGQWVRCIEVRAGKVIVRPVEEQDVANLDTSGSS